MDNVLTIKDRKLEMKLWTSLKVDICLQEYIDRNHS